MQTSAFSRPWVAGAQSGHEPCEHSHARLLHCQGKTRWEAELGGSLMDKKRGAQRWGRLLWSPARDGMGSHSLGIQPLAFGAGFRPAVLCLPRLGAP